ncbi:MAG TPA: hypothetical protein VIF62_17760 [Labilithrix sp.]
MFLLVACSTDTPTDPAASTDPSQPAGDDDDGAAPPSATDGGKPSAKCNASNCKGCCDGDTCNVHTSATKCGGGGEACTSCAASADGHACVASACGCSVNTDCEAGSICDPATYTCAKPCSDSSPCATGCCGANGLCAKGTDGKTCGGSGACTDCSGSAKGKACVAGGCGCNAASDCPYFQACDTSTHTCGTTCSDTSPCNSACCVAGSCSTAASACTGNPRGNECVTVGGVSACGCFDSSECATNMACDTKTHTCTTSCSATQNCNGGCCNAGTCNVGNTDAVCGAVPSGYVGTCFSCASSVTGGHCAGSFAKCSTCSTGADCNGSAQCVSGHCCLPKGTFNPAPDHPEYCCSDFTVDDICQ